MGVIKSFLIALLCFISVAAQASRGFGVTYGVGSTDTIQEGQAFTWPTTLSFACWGFVHGAGASNAGRFWDDNSSGSTNSVMQMNGGTVTIDIEFNHATTAGAWHFTNPSLNAWHHYVITYDGSSVSNNPVVYVDGTSVAVTKDATPVGAVSNISKNLYIGDRTAHDRGFDGMLSQYAFWSSKILTANEAKSLSQGTIPLKIEPAALTFYLPLNGAQTGEPDWGPSRGTQTITSTKKQTEPKMSASPFMNNPN